MDTLLTVWLLLMPAETSGDESQELPGVFGLAKWFWII